MGKAGKNSKNNPDNKTKRKEYKILSIIDCEKCKTKCKEYDDYIIALNTGKIGKGITCKSL